MDHPSEFRRKGRLLPAPTSGHLLLSGVVLWVAVGRLCSCGWAAEETGARNPAPARFNAEIAAFERYDRQNSAPTGAVLFVGSSSIRLWPTAESFPGVTVLNRGFGGSHVSDVNHFAERIVVKYRPRIIVFYAGDNDIADGKSPQQMMGDFKKFLSLVESRLPESHILYLPIKPSPARWKLWPQARQANALVQELAAAHPRLTYVDTASPLLGPDGGQPPGELFLDDRLHLSAKGYEKWNAVLGPALNKATGGD